MNESSSDSDTSVVSQGSTMSAVSTVSEKRKRRNAFLKDSSSGETGATARKKKKGERPPALSGKAKTRADTLPSQEEIRGELTNLPTAEIGAEITRQAEEIERVGGTSGNLKGTYVRQLKLAARTVRTATVELALRTQTDCDIRQIRAENDSLKEQVRALREEVEKLRTAVPHEGKQPSSTPPAGGTAASTARSGRPTELFSSQPTALPLVPTGEELFAKIGMMVDAKLEALRADLTTGPVSRPPLAARAEGCGSGNRNGGEEEGRE